MGVELRPMGVHCNIACQYCYQNPLREAGNVSLTYDLERMKQAVEEEGGPFTLFGGEPLLMPPDDLEALFAWGLERFGENRIQTNGTILTPEHIALFRRYRVRVGVSVDGPGDLNDVRWVGNLKRTRAMSDKTHKTIAALCEAGMAPGIIVTLHRINGSGPALERMNAWILDLEALGVRMVRLHVLEVDDPAVGDKYQLSEAEQIACFANFAALERGRLTRLRFDIFQEARDLLAADDVEAGCVWHACDPLTTKAVRGVEGLGQRSNCGRTNKDGIEYVKSAQEGFERPRALYRTPFADGGCEGCRFFLVCKGQCPGTAMATDWRNRSESCALWTALFTEAEAELERAGKRPLSRHPQRAVLEEMLLEHWARGDNPSLENLLSRFEAGDRPEPERQEASFARLSWTGERAREVWQPRLGRIALALACAGGLSVREGIHAGALVRLPLQEFARIEAVWAEAGIAPDSVRIVAETVGVSPLAPDGPLDVLQVECRFGCPDMQANPPVCAEPAARQRAARSLFQLACPPESGEDRVRMLRGPWWHNGFWGLLGLDPTQGFAAAGTDDPAGMMLELARKHGFGEEIDWLSEVLSWPVEWSVKSGIGELRTPVLKLIHDAPFDPRLKVLRREGTLLPPEAAKGHAHPFRQPKRRTISGSSTFRRGLETIGLDER